MALGREQPYLDGMATGSYERTWWLDDAPPIQDGTPVDEQHLNNMEEGILAANLLGEFLVEVVKNDGATIRNVSGDVIAVTLTNNQGAFFNNSVQTVPLPVKRDTLDYTVDVEVQGDVHNVGDIVVFDKQVNAFKVKYTGSAVTVSLKLYVHGGNVA